MRLEPKPAHDFWGRLTHIAHVSAFAQHLGDGRIGLAEHDPFPCSSPDCHLKVKRNPAAELASVWGRRALCHHHVLEDPWTNLKIGWQDHQWSKPNMRPWGLTSQDPSNIIQVMVDKFWDFVWTYVYYTHGHTTRPTQTPPAWFDIFASIPLSLTLPD